MDGSKMVALYRTWLVGEKVPPNSTVQLTLPLMKSAPDSPATFMVSITLHLRNL